MSLRQNVSELQQKVKSLGKEINTRTISGYWGECPTIYGRLVAIEDFLGVDIKVVAKQPSKVVAMKQKASKK